MMRRAGMLVLVGGLVAAGLFGARWVERPVAQLDLFTNGPAAAPSLREPGVHREVTEVLDRLGPDRVAAMLRPARGTATAGEAPTVKVLRAVEVTSVAADRIRIRVGVSDLDAGHAVAAGVGAAFLAGGLQERLRLRSETTGGRALLMLNLLAVVGAGIGLWKAGRIFARRRRVAF
ncbi:hypothetical protein L1787_24860 [Acuticoccus sp. M5D2P5]|uniref:hypothetical protein n=1 Tax=Acuticoccus kalidii TaxID=2910977 RepID=UPI001F39CD05|nr:hypothetical protein [Acuticoccus kalidii]MCF3936627.1 hypothetical protein [Acuticoccus kalidii]